MSEITEDVLTPAEPAEETPEFNFATIGSVEDDGVTLIFDGQTEATEKLYKVNTTIPFAAGDRVKICKDSGTYVVEYIVGSPGADVPKNPVPTGGSDGQALLKDGVVNYRLKWGDNGGIPSGGSDGQLLSKDGYITGKVKWLDQGDTRTGRVANNYSTSTAGNASYDIYFKTDSTYGTPNFYIRFGTNGTWKKITVS